MNRTYDYNDSENLEPSEIEEPATHKDASIFWLTTVLALLALFGLLFLLVR